MQLIQFIIGIAILIVLHELGHFLVARLLKIEVEEFGIGFPPRMVKLFEAGGTEYTLNWIPLGGFVRPKGENDPSVPGGLAAASPWVRLAVLFAGPVTNILLGVVLGIVFFYNLGEPVPNRVKIEQVMEQSPAEQAGLIAGDYILEIDGNEVASIEALQQTIYAQVGKATELTIERNGQTQTISLVPQQPTENRGAIGIYMANDYRPISISQAIQRGANLTVEYARSLLSLPMRLLAGQANPDEARLVGFKGMYDVYQEIQSPLYFFMAISMSLGLFNLLPIPALDGGRIVLTLPEIFLRRRIPQQYENIIHLVGFTLLLILLIYINVQDFINPIALPK